MNDQRRQELLELGPEPTGRRAWLASLWDHREVIWVLARKDFQTRYKRATLGVLWALFLPLLQAAVLIFIFSHIVRVTNNLPYGAFVLSGVLPWGFFAAALPSGVTAIVDNATLSDKLSFPRAVLGIVPCISGLVGLGMSMVILLVGAPILDAHLGFRTLLLVPACALLVVFTTAAGLLLSALQVYYRDVRFFATASLTVWLYLTPIMFPKSSIGPVGRWLDFNPLTGIVALFHLAIVGPNEPLLRALVVSFATTAALIVAAVEAQRHHDRLFVDLM